MNIKLSISLFSTVRDTSTLSLFTESTACKTAVTVSFRKVIGSLPGDCRVTDEALLAETT